MHKVIVERPRLGSRWLPSEKTALRLNSTQVSAAMLGPDDYDSGPGRAPARRKDKHFNEHLGPLRNYLENSVGRPWNKVYSEICQAIDTRSTIGAHVLQHVEDFIAVETRIENGKVVARRRWRVAEPVDGLYVHPLTGLIRRTKEKRRRERWRMRQPEAELNLVQVSETAEYEKIDGYWFRMEYRINDVTRNPELPTRSLVLKRQCDSKTSRRIDAGELGTVVDRRHAVLRRSPR